MRALICCLLLCLCWVLPAGADEPGTNPSTRPAVRFVPIDVYLDVSETPLAAYQIELIAEADDTALVGVEGGEHPAFVQPPYYDPEALYGHRIILAAFSTEQELPTGLVRVARLHVRTTASDQPQFKTHLQTAANRDGAPIAAAVVIREGDTP